MRYYFRNYDKGNSYTEMNKYQPDVPIVLLSMYGDWISI